MKTTNIKIFLNHAKAAYIDWKCRGLWVRTKSTYSSIRERYLSLNAGVAFKSDGFCYNGYKLIVGVVDVDGNHHRFDDIRPASKKERKQYKTRIIQKNPYLKLK